MNVFDRFMSSDDFSSFTILRNDDVFSKMDTWTVIVATSGNPKDWNFRFSLLKNPGGFLGVLVNALCTRKPSRNSQDSLVVKTRTFYLSGYSFRTSLSMGGSLGFRFPDVAALTYFVGQLFLSKVYSFRLFLLRSTNCFAS